MKATAIIVLGIMAGCAAGMLMPKPSQEPYRQPAPVADSTTQSCPVDRPESPTIRPDVSPNVPVEVTPNSAVVAEASEGPRIISTSTILGRQAPTRGVITSVAATGPSAPANPPSSPRPKQTAPPGGAGKC